MSAHRRWRLPASVLRNAGRAARDFYLENGVDKASILAYYSIFSSFFLLIFFSYAVSRLTPEASSAIQGMYPFSPDFIERIVPGFFRWAARLSAVVEEFGMASVAMFLVMGALVFGKAIHYINEMFHIAIRKGFFLKRLQEFALLALVAALTAVSFLAGAFVQLLNAELASGRIRPALFSPRLLLMLDSLLLRFVLPFLIACLFFFILFKWIPEKRVCTRGALFAAFLCAGFWEVAKRSYAYFLIHFSLLGQMRGSIITVILFGFWMEINMGIMLYGAKLTYLFDREASCSS